MGGNRPEDDQGGATADGTHGENQGIGWVSHGECDRGRKRTAQVAGTSWRGYVVVCAVALALVATVPLASAMFSPEAFQKAADARAVTKMVEAQKAAQDVLEADIPMRLAEAKRANPDVCAWVRFPNTNVSLPILQNVEDDRHYVGTSFDGKDGDEGALGAAFIEASSSPYFIDPVTVVYGHAFEDAPDVMLGQLHRFEDKAFFDANDTFLVYLDDRVLEYRIACACVYVCDHIPWVIRAGGEGTLQRYMEYALDPGVDANFVRDVGAVEASSDRIVQFSTCTFPSSTEYRYMVTGVLVGERSAA